MNHKGPRLFITGIPTGGKSYLAQLLAEQTNGLAVFLDDTREAMSKDERYKKWVNFYLDQDEEEYLTKTSPEDQWKNLVSQSEVFWPVMLERIASFADDKRTIIFECVNLLPHLAKKDINFPGIVIIGSSLEETFKRNMKAPRWGNTLELQSLEAKCFFEVERPRYKAEAEKYGYPVFEKADDAVETALDLLRK